MRRKPGSKWLTVLSTLMEKSKKVSSNPPAVMQTHKRNEISEYVLEAFRSRLVEVPGARVLDPQGMAISYCCSRSSKPAQN
jgi:hypothetical protein